MNQKVGQSLFDKQKCLTWNQTTGLSSSTLSPLTSRGSSGRWHGFNQGPFTRKSTCSASDLWTGGGGESGDRKALLSKITHSKPWDLEMSLGCSYPVPGRLLITERVLTLKDLCSSCFWDVLVASGMSFSNRASSNRLMALGQEQWQMH